MYKFIRTVILFLSISIFVLFRFNLISYAQTFPTATVTPYWLTVNNGPSYNDPAIDWLKKGTKVRIEKTLGNYSYIVYQGRHGYVQTRFLKIENNSLNPSSPTRVYLVKSGDALSLIAQKVHMTVEQLKSMNHLTSDTIYAGQKLLVNNPSPGSASIIHYTVQSGDSLSWIANHFHTSIQQLKTMNGLKSDTIYIGEKLIVSNSKDDVTVSNYQPLKGKTIVISPGHGGIDSGAVGNGVVEKEVNLAIGLKTEADLKDQGAKVIMARTRDVHVTLADRAGLADQYHADIFIAIHANEFPVSSIHGTTTYYNSSPYKGQSNPFPHKSELLAKDILNAVTKEAGTSSRKAQKQDFYVLRNNSVPSTLIETAFLSNKREAAMLKTDAWRSKVAEGITKGIDHYFGS